MTIKATSKIPILCFFSFLKIKFDEIAKESMRIKLIKRLDLPIALIESKPIML
jgi:hypothetical protein